MRFLDTNVLVYSYLFLDRSLDDSSRKIKLAARKIMKRIDESEKVVSSLLHLSELANILESKIGVEEARDVVERILDNDNLTLLEVDSTHCQSAVKLGEEIGMGFNDALAVILMDILGITEIYSFDKHFDKVRWIERIVA